MWWNSKTQIVMNLKCECWQNSKTWIVTQLKNLNCDKIKKKTILWQISKTQILITQIVREKKLNSKFCTTQIATKLETSKHDQLKLEMWQNLNTQIVTKHILWQISIYEEKKLYNGLLVSTSWQPMRCSLGSVLRFLWCFSFCPLSYQKNLLKWMFWEEND